MMVFSGHDGLVSNGLFSADGKYICSGGEDGTVRLWHPRTGVSKHCFEYTIQNKEGHEAMVTCMDVDHDLLLTGNSTSLTNTAL
jgi:WD40 repeat protein